MEIVHDETDLLRYMKEAVQVSGDSPVLIDTFLNDATEVDVDAICDGTDVFVAGIMQHIEEAGVHSGDSACSLPPYSLPEEIIAELEAPNQIARHRAGGARIDECSIRNQRRGGVFDRGKPSRLPNRAVCRQSHR